jgi:PhnB protein
MQPIPYLMFQGQCRQAMDTYADILNGQVTSALPATEAKDMYIDHGDTMYVPPDRAEWLAHCEMTYEDGVLMGADDLTGATEPGGGFWVRAAFSSLDRAGSVFNRFERECCFILIRGFAPNAWTEGFGMLTDRYGVHWMITAPWNKD